MTINTAAVPGHDWPGIRVHTVDNVHPPGIGIPPIAVMARHRVTVAFALKAKSKAANPMNPIRVAGITGSPVLPACRFALT
jgi:hypothetical protein